MFQSTARGFGSIKCIDFQSSDLLLMHTHAEQKEAVIAAFVSVSCYVREPSSTGCHEVTANTFTVLY